ncbi:MAG: rhodanese-like domain-containing protein [Syntrophotaleaceae bacterium]
MNSTWLKFDWRPVVRNALLISLAAFALGLAVNGRLLWQVFNGRTVSSEASPAAGSEVLLPLPVELDEVRELVGGETLLVDARTPEAYLEGHLPGAVSLPLGADAKRLKAFRREVPPDRPLILYCSGYGCPDSFILAEELLASGYRDVRVYEGGVPEWIDAGLPVEKGEL